jgi:Molybdopterin oxidoreductase N-terminal domain
MASVGIPNAPRPCSLLAIGYGTIHFVNVQTLTRAGLARFLVQIGSAAEKPVHSIPPGSHWGIYEVEVADGRIRHARPSPHDPDPGTMYGALPEIVDHATRVWTPAVRESYLRARRARAFTGQLAVSGKNLSDRSQ